MKRIDAFKLRKAIAVEEFDYYLLCNALSGYSAIRQKINELLKAAIILRVKKGLYTFGPDYTERPICKELLANLIFGPSYVSLESALSYHGLIPDRVETVTSVTLKRSKNFMTPHGRFTYRHLGTQRYSHGIEQIWTDSKHPVLMASPEKALCDYVTLNKISKIEDANEAKEFLENDLRIDSSQWNRFNPKVLRELNKYYENLSIKNILEVL